MLLSWKNWLAKLRLKAGQCRSNGPHRRPIHNCRPCLEALEDRITPAPITFSTITEFVPSSFSGDITVGPNNNLWFTEGGAGKIGEINPATNAITEFSVTAPYSPEKITSGPNGNIWYVETSGNPNTNAVGEMTPNGQVVSDTLLPDMGEIGSLAVGPDNNLWFTEGQLNKIGTFDTTTHTPGEIDLTSGFFPDSIIDGGDGNLYFGEFGNIGQIDPVTQNVNLYPLNDSSYGATNITLGPDGNIWFSEYEGSGEQIGRFNLSTHAVDDFDLPDPTVQAFGITSGPDGNLWFTEGIVNQYDPGQSIGVMNTSGQVLIEMATPTANCQPQGIVKGPDGNVWFTESNAGPIGKAAPLAPITAIQEGNPATFLMPSFRDPNSGAISWDGNVGWGDGTFDLLINPNDPNAAIVPGPLASEFHTYQAAGTYTVTITITDTTTGNLHFTGSVTFEVTVTSPTPVVPTITDATAVTTIAPGNAMGVSYVVHDPDTINPIAVTINWGDGSTPFQHNFTGALGRYLINVNHTYDSTGVYYATVTITTHDHVSVYASTKINVNTGLIGNGLIAFSSNRGGFYDIYTGDVGSNTYQNLTNNGSATISNDEPAFSPDGSEIVFTSNHDDASHTQIYVMHANGDSVTRLTNDAANDSAPVWSPDGKFIAFVSDRSGHKEIWVMNAASGDTNSTPAVELTKLGGFAANPTWGGNMIAFQFQQPGTKDQIFALNVTETNGHVQPGSLLVLTPLTGAGNNFEPAVSPDGSQIAFTSDRFGNNQILVMSSSGGPAAYLTDDSFDDRTPAWSPDGTQIVYSSTSHVGASGSQNIFTMSASGANPTALSTGSASGNNVNPAWQSVQRPFNDDISDATPIAPTKVPDNGTLTSSNVNASKRHGNFLTAEPNEPNHATEIGEIGGGKSVWFVFTSPVDGTVMLNTLNSVFTSPGSNNSTLLAVYTLGANGALAAVTQMIGGSTVQFHATPGIRYYIAVDGYNDGSGAASGIIKLDWSFAVAPPVEILSSIYPKGQPINSPAAVTIDTSLDYSDTNNPANFAVFVLKGQHFRPNSMVYVASDDLAHLSAAAHTLGLTTTYNGSYIPFGSTTFISDQELDWSVRKSELAIVLGFNEQFASPAALLGIVLQDNLTKFNLVVGASSKNHSAPQSITITAPREKLDTIDAGTVDAANGTTTYTLTGKDFLPGSLVYWAPGNQGYQQVGTTTYVSDTQIKWTVPTKTLVVTQKITVSSQAPLSTDPFLTLVRPKPVDPVAVVTQANASLTPAMQSALSGKRGLLSLPPAIDSSLVPLVNGAGGFSNNLVTILRTNFADLQVPGGDYVAHMVLDQEGATFYAGSDKASLVHQAGDLLKAGANLVGVGVGEVVNFIGGLFGHGGIVKPDVAANGQLAFTGLLKLMGSSSVLNIISRSDGALIGSLWRVNGYIEVHNLQGKMVGAVANVYNTNYAAFYSTDGLFVQTAGQAAAVLGNGSEAIIGTIRPDSSGNMKLASSVGSGFSGVISHDGGTLVATGGGNVVSNEGGSLVSTNGGNLVAQGGGNLVAQGGGNLVAQGGGNVVSHDGGTFGYINASGKIISYTGGNIIAQGGGNIIAQGGGNLVGHDGTSLTLANFLASVPSLLPAATLSVSNGVINLNYAAGVKSITDGFFVAPSSVIAQGGGNLVAQGGGNLVAQGGGNLIGTVSANGLFSSLISEKGGGLISEYGAG